MVERRVVQPAGLQLSNLAQPHIIEIAKSPSGQPAIVGLDDGQGNGPDLSAVVQESARPALLLGDQSAADPFFDFSGKPISHLSVAFGGGRPRGSEPAGSHAGEAAFPTRTQDGSDQRHFAPCSTTRSSWRGCCATKRSASAEGAGNRSKTPRILGRRAFLKPSWIRSAMLNVPALGLWHLTSWNCGTSGISWP
jgi:hypothetical protein